jgi:hypothetical protein
LIGLTCFVVVVAVVVVVQTMIDLAQLCESLNNFNGVMAILVISQRFVELL